MNDNRNTVIDAALDFTRFVGGRKFKTILADPPWQFQNRTGKIAPEHKRLSRYGTMVLDDIKALPVENAASETSHLYLWVPNALLPEGLAVMAAWGFNYKSNIVWQKVRKDGGPDGRGVGFYFRNVTELLLFGVRGKNARTLQPGRTQVNIMSTRKREHSRKPDEQYDLIQDCRTGRFGVTKRTRATNRRGLRTRIIRKNASRCCKRTKTRRKPGPHLHLLRGRRSKRRRTAPLRLAGRSTTAGKGCQHRDRCGASTSPSASSQRRICS
jgi:N6-adenosine-specific RNA methylase IME4